MNGKAGSGALRADPDVLGIGFGPSNLALAVALRECAPRYNGGAQPRCEFIERQATFGWHRGMLIDGATMQVSFIKDLVTMRDPTSRFSFLAYLHAKGRLAGFINHKTLYPTRIEFHDYLEWVAKDFADIVSYGHEAESVDPVVENGRVTHLEVAIRQVASGQLTSRRTRNLVMANGLRPRLPAGVSLDHDIWHSSEFLDRAAGLDADKPLTFAVIGAGQSAAEVVEYVYRHFRRSTVISIFSRYGFSPADDTPFVNRIFDPEAVDIFYEAPENVKRMMLDYHRNTNYSAVDADLIDELYRRYYQERVTGESRLRILNTARLSAVGRAGERLRVVVHAMATGELLELSPDVLVCATGYRPTEPETLLGSFVKYCKTNDQGSVAVDRNYRVITNGAADCAVFLQGTNDNTHGISSSLLSNTAKRAGEIADAILSGGCASRPGPTSHAFMAEQV